MSLHIVSSKTGPSDVVELLWLSIIKEIGINTAELLSNSYFAAAKLARTKNTVSNPAT